MIFKKNQFLIRMPYVLRANSDGTYAVVNAESRKVHAKHTTKEKAKAQIRLLNGVEHGMVPRAEKKKH